MRNPPGIKARISHFFLPYLSIRKWLPFIICTLLSCTVIIFISISYVGMKKSVFVAGSERLNNPLTSMPGEAIRFQIASISRIAEPSVQKYLQSDGRKSQTQALISHQELTQNTLLSFVELLNGVERLLVFRRNPFDIVPSMDKLTYSSRIIHKHRGGSVARGGSRKRRFLSFLFT